MPGQLVREQALAEGDRVGLGRLIESGRSRIVLDNTYVSRKSRAA